MSNSSTSSTSSPERLAPLPWVKWTLLLASLVGLADATYLTLSHYTGEGVTCSVLAGCEQVLTSEYATIQGVPISLFGILYYAGVFLAAYYFHLTGLHMFRRAYRGMILVGALVTAYLVYLQLAVIEAICQYCMVSALLTLILLVAVTVEYFRRPTA